MSEFIKPMQIDMDALFQASRQTTPGVGSHDFSHRFCHLLSAALKGCQKDRYEVACEMSRLTGDDITKAMLDSWTSQSKEQNRFPAQYLPAFMFVVGSNEPLEFLADKSGCLALTGDEAAMVVEARIDHAIKDLQKKKRDLKKRQSR